MRAYLSEKRFTLRESIPLSISFIFVCGAVALLLCIHVRPPYSIIILGFGYYVLSMLQTVSQILRKKITRPKVSLRNILITAATTGLVMLPGVISFLFFAQIYKEPILQDSTIVPADFNTIFPTVNESNVLMIPLETISVVLFFALLFVIDLLLPLFISVFVIATSIIVVIHRNRKVRAAKKKISEIENLKIIGVTGSFGKSTTKEILKIILHGKFKVFATPKNINTDIGVATVILNNTNHLADVFIVEMGAYKRGEVRKMCEIARPDISIITGINEQHIALFGTLENTLRAKYEIVEYAKEDATVILNGDSHMTLHVAGKSQKREIVYSTEKELDLWASDIKSDGDHVEFNVHHGTDVHRFQVRMLGEHNVSNILAATAAARSLGMSLQEIATVLREQSQARRIGKLNVVQSKFGYKVINDSYNANPAGFSAALEVLSNTKGKRKILVTIGILELGGQTSKIYKQLAEQIVAVCDVLVTSDETLQKFVREKNPSFRIVFDRGVDKQIQFLTKEVGQDDVVLFEGPNLRLIKEVLGEKK